MTFGALVELYMEECKSRLKPTTYENKEYVIGLKVLPYFKDMPINTIDRIVGFTIELHVPKTKHTKIKETKSMCSVLKKTGRMKHEIALIISAIISINLLFNLSAYYSADWTQYSHWRKRNC